MIATVSMVATLHKQQITSTPLRFGRDDEFFVNISDMIATLA